MTYFTKKEEKKIFQLQKLYGVFEAEECEET